MCQRNDKTRFENHWLLSNADRKTQQSMHYVADREPLMNLPSLDQQSNNC